MDDKASQDLNLNMEGMESMEAFLIEHPPDFFVFSGGLTCGKPSIPSITEKPCGEDLTARTGTGRHRLPPTS